MFDSFKWLFDTTDFNPRWYCGLWTPAEGWLHICSDLAIWGAYTAIPLVLLYFIRRRKDVPFLKIFWLFGVFIFACGTTHLIEAIIFWHPIYRVAGLVKLATAIASWGTVVALVQVTPQALRLPGLAKLNAELTTEIQERREAQERLRQSEASERAARTEAERAGRVKDEFLSLVSHELRNPLNAILGYAQVLGSPTATPDDVKRAAQVIERNGRAQAQIIDDLLDMSRIESGKMRLDVQSIELVDVIRAAVESVQPAADAKEIHVHLVLDPRAGHVLGDSGRLQQVCWNLLANAVKFTPKGGRVQVSLQKVNSHVEINVSDNGQGIKAEFLPFVFERFRQQDPSMSRQHGGLGLGLTIVKQLVELHGGTIQVTSPGEGNGSTFTVKLPLQMAPTQTAGPDRMHPRIGGAMPSGYVVPELAGLKVLMVDDEPDARAIVQRFLEDHGVEVIVAESGEQGLALVREAHPDIVLSDIGMPNMDGYQFIRQLRALADRDGGGVPAAALTAFARMEDRTRVLLAGYQAHITKPIHPSELAAVIAALAGRIGR